MFWSKRGLRVLMYHKVDRTAGDALTVTVEQLRLHLEELRSKAWDVLSCSGLLHALETGRPISPRAVIVTFDDAYRSVHDLALPLLQDYRIPATIFVPTAYIGGESSWDQPSSALMTPAELSAMVERGCELGFHSHTHRSFRDLAPSEIAEEIEAGRRAFDENGLPAVPILAYPYGARPTEKARRDETQHALRKSAIHAAFRIGNRINRAPLRALFELNRLSIRGDEGLAAFRRRLRWGRIF
jgi:peptidoglycan/xylan/chitin deacetylase (PgdA/CDA1 family)